MIVEILRFLLFALGIIPGIFDTFGLHNPAFLCCRKYFLALFCLGRLRVKLTTHTQHSTTTPPTPGNPATRGGRRKRACRNWKGCPCPLHRLASFSFLLRFSFLFFRSSLLPGWGGSCRNYSHKVYYGHSLYTVFIYRLTSVTVAITGFFYSFSRFMAALASSRVATLLSTNVLFVVVRWSGGVSCQS